MNLWIIQVIFFECRYYFEMSHRASIPCKKVNRKGNRWVVHFLVFTKPGAIY